MDKKANVKKEDEMDDVLTMFGVMLLGMSCFELAEANSSNSKDGGSSRCLTTGHSHA